MASLWFLKLALKSFDHFAWPLLALGYPLCASVQAIETDSYTETRDLISYWILLSLLYLFEYFLMSLIQWFQFWPYIKLMIIIWLIIPDFGRASYVYNNLIHPCISINWRKFFVEKENILLHADTYRKENGTEALEKLIASKDTTYKPEAEATNAIRATYKEMLQTNGERLQTERKDIKDLEVIEKKEIPAVKQVIPVMPNLAPSHNASTSTTMVETRGIAGKDRSGGELPQSSTTHKVVQKEWTCALCQVTASSEHNLNSHLHGRRHRDASIALKAKTKAASQKLKINQSKEELKQKNIINQLNSKTKNEGESTVNKRLKGNVSVDHMVKALQKNLSAQPFRISKLKCEVCNVTCSSVVDMTIHLNGKKHLANIQS